MGNGVRRFCDVLAGVYGEDKSPSLEVALGNAIERIIEGKNEKPHILLADMWKALLDNAIRMVTEEHVIMFVTTPDYYVAMVDAAQQYDNVYVVSSAFNTRSRELHGDEYALLEFAANEVERIGSTLNMFSQLSRLKCLNLELDTLDDLLSLPEQLDTHKVLYGH